MLGMRTMIHLDEDLARQLKELAHREARSLEQVVNDAVRRGLAGREAAEPTEAYRVATFRGGFRGGVDPLKLNLLVDALETERALGPRNDGTR